MEFNVQSTSQLSQDEGIDRKRDSTPFISGGHYIYLETSTGAAGCRAQLSSPRVSVSGGESSCLSLWYHMYGEDVSTLTVYRNTQALWTRSGDQGNRWLQARIAVRGPVSNQKVLNEMNVSPGKRRIRPLMTGQFSPLTYCAIGGT